MSEYFSILFFSYLPHIAVFLMIFGLIARFVYRNDTIHAKSTQFLQDNKPLRISLLMFHWGILAVLAGHIFGLFTPRWMYTWLFSVEVKRILAISMGGFFGICAVIGIVSLLVRRLKNERIRINSAWGDIAIEIILCLQIFLGLTATTITTISPVSQYLIFDKWAQSVITFQPMSGEIISSVPWVYKVHIICGCLIFIILPYSKLTHFFVAPLQYIWRKAAQLVSKNLNYQNNY